MVTSHLATVAVADQLAPDMVVEGIGPMSVALETPGVPPDARWQASPHVVAAVVRLVEQSGARNTVAAACAWAVQDDDTTLDARGSLASMGCRSAAMFPPVLAVVSKATASRLLVALSYAGAPATVLQQWLTTISTLLTHRASITGEVAESVLRAGAPFMPRLPDVANRPLGT
ncbi:MAG: hypothetical protein FWE71_08040 [Nocardioidaceae bacterium]|nr:hypothetical protein [Nocardioidaceae bacterium]MCL2613154.1 hypothetical protein [Nocardioidaceae bacterium]